MSLRVRASAPRVTRVLLRLPPDLHRTLVADAAAAGLSFNEYSVRRLRAPMGPHAASDAPGLVVARARTVFGDRLLGVLALGSWVRGEATADSDIDVLVVIDEGTPLTRDLYRQWDTEPLVIDGRSVDAHFVHLSTGSTPGAVWCEAAVDGVVWFDRDGRVATRLAEVRRAIAERRVVRGVAHGQPYWKGAA
jgi:predicted nucleotidyltransferase